jgi:two-component system, chemotaxis family, chemotaxis protein CheY
MTFEVYTVADTQCVLLIEDNVAIQDLLRTWLELMGFSVFLAQNGQEALTRLETMAPCLILLDLKLPYMDGYAFLEALEQQQARPAIPTIVITADVEAKQRLAGKGVPVFLKPFKFNDLLATIKQYC